MKPKMFALRLGAMKFLLALAFAALGMLLPAKAQQPKTAYPTMAPLEQYLMADRDAEIALARSGAPDSISHDAEIQVLSRSGYQTAVHGKNGFVCLVQRSFAAAADDPVFWNPKLRGPTCFNAAAVRSFLPLIYKKTEWVLAGRTAEQIGVAIDAAITRRDLPTPEPGAMCYMMSKGAYLSDDNPHWHPHLMFFTPQTDAPAWGADLPGSPVISATAKSEHLTIFMVPVRRWSDGTPDTPN